MNQWTKAALAAVPTGVVWAGPYDTNWPDSPTAASTKQR